MLFECCSWEKINFEIKERLAELKRNETLKVKIETSKIYPEYFDLEIIKRRKKDYEYLGK